MSQNPQKQDDPQEEKPEQNERTNDPEPSEAQISEIQEILGEKLGKEIPIDIVQQVIAISQSSFSGPIPHPRHLREYDEIIPNGGDRIMSMAEKEQEHRHKIDDNNSRIQVDVVEADLKRAGRGQWMAYSIIMILALGAIILLFFGKPIAGLISLGGALAAATVQIFGPKLRTWQPLRREGKEKEEE